MDPAVAWYQEEQEGPSMAVWLRIWETNTELYSLNANYGPGSNNGGGPESLKGSRGSAGGGGEQNNNNNSSSLQQPSPGGGEANGKGSSTLGGPFSSFRLFNYDVSFRTSLIFEKLRVADGAGGI
uniref:Uncharacterized protein n=1 Tax=Anopheles atroparvus TaxID=41427 RepID=A0A182JBT2_ANOAO